ncbi:hypothetical protein P389DRAFT_30374 [Cystobasidium minutum MCA 4210]|uniref:uncharacterized protein n=1 Tax=Cystobasidium minutum MCA 4210 TaxID=1397322 RepID=UPI0034CE5270|eukprot:jgi/Rhomi1/30374/CE30373_961
MFGQSFEGQTRSRPTINLSGSAAGGASTSSASSSAGPSTPGEHSIANRARLERAHREQQRKLDRNARTIQAFYRSRQSAGSARDATRREYDALAIGSTSDSRALLQATRLLAFIFTPVIQAKKASSRQKCSKADLDRLGRWSRTMAVGKPRVALFQQFDNLAGNSEDLQRYAFLLQRLARVMLAQAADNPR